MSTSAALAPAAARGIAVLDGHRADVIRLDAHRAAPGVGPGVGVGSRRVTRATYWRRRLGVLVAVTALALLLVAVVGQSADADLVTPEVAGSVVVEPGTTLWEVAIEHAPPGEDPRAYLVRIEQLNGLAGTTVPAWTVVLLPAA